MSTDDGLGGVIPEQADQDGQQTEQQAQQVVEAPALDWGEYDGLAQQRGWKAPGDVAKSYANLEPAYSRSQQELAAMRREMEERDRYIAEVNAYLQQQGQQPQQPDQWAGDVDPQVAALQAQIAEMQRQQQQWMEQQQGLIAPVVTGWQQQQVDARARDLAAQNPDYLQEIDEARRTVLADPNSADPELVELAFLAAVGRRQVEEARGQQARAAGQTLDVGARGPQETQVDQADAIRDAIRGAGRMTPDGL